MTMDEQFVDHVWLLIDYWKNEPMRPNWEEKMEGLAFSILVALDGGSQAPSLDDLSENAEHYMHEVFYERRPIMEEDR